MSGKRKNNKVHSNRSHESRDKASPETASVEAHVESPPLNANWFARNAFKASLLSMAMLWTSMPPLANWTLNQINNGWSSFPVLSILAWIALVPLVGIVISRDLPKKSLRKIWIGSWMFWAATMYFIPIPHPALWIGWFALSLYLSMFVPLFVIAARTMIFKFRVPAVLAIPIAWVGFEYIRTTYLTGFGLTLIAHSQYKIPIVIQIADLFGAYTVSFVLVFVTVCLASLVLSTTPAKTKLVNVGLAVLMIAGVLTYGRFRLVEGSIVRENQPRSLEVAILQGNIDTIFPSSPEQMEEFEKFKVDHYRKLASTDEIWKHGSSGSKVDLVLWPEGKYPAKDWFVESNQTVPEHLQEKFENFNSFFDFCLAWAQTIELTRDDSPDMKTNPTIIASIVGTQSYNPATDSIYNSAILLDSEGNVASKYFKNHRVMFGEYVPFESMFPFLSSISPLGKGLTPGPGGAALVFEDFVFCPNICFESCVPHLIHRQVNQLSGDGLEPDFIANLSDDGWFYGTSCLDFHLANSVFRAVELRKPTLAAANTGLSANIDGCGNILDIGPRREAKIMFVRAKPDGRFSFYRTVGGWPAFVLHLICLVALAVAGNHRFFGVNHK